MTVAIIEAMCPGCLAVLRFPPAWAQQPLRCKRCGLITAGNPAPPEPPRFPVAIPLPGPPRQLAGSVWPRVAFLSAWLVGMGILAAASYWAFTTPPEAPRHEPRVRGPQASLALTV